MACEVGDGLVPATAKFAKIAMGFNDIFGWVVDSTSYKPETDKYAVTFFQPVLEMLKALVENSALSEVKDSYNRSIDYWVQYWLAEADVKTDIIISWLKRNKQSLVIYENGKLSTTSTSTGTSEIDSLIATTLALGVIQTIFGTVTKHVSFSEETAE